MSLADLHETTPRPPRSVCSVAKILDTLDDNDRAWLNAVLEDPEETGAAIGRTLTRAGHPIAGTTISRHRRGDCTCA
ncbi:hypothetical protein JN535_08585 [Cellulosimicrobium cellulans]|uniref:hypothetical protein n=1 Tax=Cellulosimicrobium cellulans TaxID=1710 RepID=UPI0019649A9E|nr:hypothetical protein [Cellulosimicrobium cellulans]MBN0040222.1 hypothetical protein [Cellulosimicrobium cellulans]